MNEEQLLLAEYRHFSESLWKNEDIGERRVNFLITLVTAVTAALVALWTKKGSAELGLSDQAIVRITAAALLGLLLFGILTFLRMLHRDHVTKEYKGIVDYLRAQMQFQSQHLDEYELPFREGRHRLLRGGLAPTVAIMNSITASMLCWVAWPSWPWTSAVAGFELSVLLHLPSMLKKGGVSITPRAERFRAGVGAVIYKDEGLVLNLERRDLPGSWQLPQGGIKQGETVEQALFREIKEETGLTRAAFRNPSEFPVWLGYELPREWRSDKTGRGQVHQWFFLEFAGEDAKITLGTAGEFKNWRWSDLSQVADAGVEFRRPVYHQLAASWRSRRS